MPLSQQQYAQARYAARAAALAANRRRPIIAVSVLRDRTPQKPEKPLDEGQVIWGGPSSFSWGSRDRSSGPSVSTNFSVNWPDYGLQPDPDPKPDDSDYEDDEREVLPPVIQEWTEVYREERTVRVDGPDGAYVDIAVIEKVTFELPATSDGRAVFVRLRFQ